MLSKIIFHKNKIQKAQQILKKLVLKDRKIAQNLDNFAKDKKFSQKWITNLLNIDPVFIDLIQPKIAMKVFEKILGENFIVDFMRPIVFYQVQEVSFTYRLPI